MPSVKDDDDDGDDDLFSSKPILNSRKMQKKFLFRLDEKGLQMRNITQLAAMQQQQQQQPKSRFRTREREREFVLRKEMKSQIFNWRRKPEKETSS